MKIRKAKPADAPSIARVHVDVWRSTYGGIVPKDYLASLSYEKRRQRWTERLTTPTDSLYAVYIVEDEKGKIVGFVDGGSNRKDDPVYKGELYAIYILEGYQGRGIGKQLTLVLAESLLEMGLDTMLIWVFAKNISARRFYKSLGGHYISNGWFEISNLPIEEVAYGWLDIRSLLKRQRQ